ncbi:2-dehydro-3-deoxygalactonokinase [Microcella sp.]|uniref:2-dehydro-3-deoxygalactonokinase n=1 Tax=Microcella sp. TaxID=1913979 RepID=UPI003F6F6793
MTAPPIDEIVSIDWGTTSLRATVVTRGEPGASVRGATGVRGRTPADLATALDTVMAELPETRGPIVLSGMIGSTAGLMVVPYVDAPAGVSEIAQAVTRVPADLLGPACANREVVIVPGVRVEAPSGDDLMRGEETQVLGQGITDGVVIAPGSHSKWITISEGRIVGFTTAMTGEAFAALGRHTLLSESLTPDLSVDDEQRNDFVRAVTDAHERELLFTLFSVRSGAIAGSGRAASTARLSGLVIGAELHGGLAWAGHPSHITVVADETLAEWYRVALNQVDVTVTIATRHAAAQGAWRITQEGWPQ